MVTNEEAEEIDELFLESMPEYRDYSAETAKKLLAAWDYLWSIMEREDNFSDHLGNDMIDWQIGNFANDTVETVHNARLYKEEIRVNEQILKIKWSGHDNIFHENAKRDIADAYAYMGDVQKSYELYNEYLTEDPLWGWAWIGYFRRLNDNNDERFETVLDELYQKTQAGVDFRDKEDLYRELGDEYNTLGNRERADYFYNLEDKEKQSTRVIRYAPFKDQPVVKAKKIYPNDPCPCGSGKKYKKCCGRNK